MKTIKRFGLIFIVLVILISCLPLSAFAVDPMSSAMIANAFAQAIASYGASQGAAMGFDVNSTDGIGEGVHELWQQFREDSQDPDDFAYYANLFINTNPYSLLSVAGSAGYVAVTIDESIKPSLDDFWNWLLSGPAEMVKVDDQYYEWSSEQIGDNAVGIPVYSVGTISINGNELTAGPVSYNDSSNTLNTILGSDNYFYIGYYPSQSLYQFYIVTQNSSVPVEVVYPWSPGNVNSGSMDMTSQPSYGPYYYRQLGSSSSPVWGANIVVYESSSSYLDPPHIFGTYVSSGTISDSAIDLYAYGMSTTAEFPDSSDPNYDALHPPIPLNIPWDQTAYGDGTGTLTDAQTQSIVSDLVGALEQDGTVELAETTNPPVTPDFQDVILPLIPISLPSFNFSLSGIWHYVRDWVNSLGAWLSLLFTTWSYLPYAISVPVYASLVVVIVLGLYRRFFM